MSNTKNKKTINGVPLREAETNDERLLLGFLNQEAQRIQYGTVVCDFSVRNGKIDRIRSQEISRTFNIGGRDS